MQSSNSCQIPDCESPAHGRWCWMHHKRAERGRPLEAPSRGSPPTLDEIRGAIEDLDDADSEDDTEYSRREEHLLKLLRGYERSRARRPTKRRKKAIVGQTVPSLSKPRERVSSHRANSAGG